MKLKTFTYQSAQIFYRTIGKGKPLILIHGFAEDGDVWKNQIEFLKDHFTVIIPDLPGTGKSDMIAGMSILGMADVIKEILIIELSKFALQQAVLIGHSMGGYITLAFAENYPTLLNAFGLVHSTAFADSEEKKLARLKSIEFIKANGAYEFLKTSIPGLFWRQDGSNSSDAYIKALTEKAKNFSSEALAQYYQAMINRPDRTAVLKDFNGPILFIIGEHDMAVPFQQSLQQCYLPVRSHINILRNSAHMGMLEEAGRVNQIFIDFVNQFLNL